MNTYINQINKYMFTLLLDRLCVSSYCSLKLAGCDVGAHAVGCGYCRPVGYTVCCTVWCVYACNQEWYEVSPAVRWQLPLQCGVTCEGVCRLLLVRLSYHSGAVHAVVTAVP